MIGRRRAAQVQAQVQTPIQELDKEKEKQPRIASSDKVSSPPGTESKESIKGV